MVLSVNSRGQQANNLITIIPPELIDIVVNFLFEKNIKDGLPFLLTCFDASQHSTPLKNFVRWHLENHPCKETAWAKIKNLKMYKSIFTDVSRLNLSRIKEWGTVKKDIAYFTGIREVAFPQKINQTTPSRDVDEGDLPLETLDFGKSDTTNPQELRHIVKRCKKIRSLTLNGSILSNMTNKHLLAIAPHCTTLQSLSLDSGSDQVSSKGLIPLLQNAKLTSLTLQNYEHNKEKETLCAVATHCPELETLDLDGNYSIPAEGMYTVLEKCKKLKSLCTPNLTDEILLFCTSQWGNIEELDFDLAMRAITDKGLCAVFGSCKKLKVLHLSLCLKISDKTLLALADNCPELTDFSFYWGKGVTTRGLIEILQKCTKLRSLLVEAKNIESDLLPLAPYCSALETLSFLDIRQWDEEVIASILENSKSLKTLKIDYWRNSDEHLLALASHLPPALKTIDLEKGTKITGVGIQAILLRCPDIKTLVLNNCASFCDKYLVEMAPYCKNVESLNLSNLNIHFEGLLQFLQSCKKIRLLELKGCKKLNEESIDFIRLKGIKVISG